MQNNHHCCRERSVKGILLSSPTIKLFNKCLWLRSKQTNHGHILSAATKRFMIWIKCSCC